VRATREISVSRAFSWREGKMERKARGEREREAEEKEEMERDAGI